MSKKPSESKSFESTTNSSGGNGAGSSRLGTMMSEPCSGCWSKNSNNRSFPENGGRAQTPPWHDKNFDKSGYQYSIPKTSSFVSSIQRKDDKTQIYWSNNMHPEHHSKSFEKLNMDDSEITYTRSSRMGAYQHRYVRKD